MSQPDPAFPAGVEPSIGPWRTVAPGVFVAVAEPDAVNLGLIVGADAALLVDTGSSPEHGRTVRATVAGVTDRPLIGAVVTHWHYDHAFGLAAFSDLATIGHDSLPDRLRSPEAATEAARLGLDPSELADPNLLLVVATAVDLGGRRVEIAHLGRGHTDGDLVVVVSDADLVFAGDLIESAGPPSFGPDSVPNEWAGTLDGLIGLMTAKTVAVPGHGAPVGREFVFEQRGRIAMHAAEFTSPPQPGSRPELPLA
jgi:glyoxylase-like metal-dependent hydrolase (beta-lactamase superfamily II)